MFIMMENRVTPLYSSTHHMQIYTFKNNKTHYIKNIIFTKHANTHKIQSINILNRIKAKQRKTKIKTD